jgi:hypothetical protein
MELGATTWLLTAAKDMDIARREWRTMGVALLRCGGVFTAIRVPTLLVETAVGSENRQRMGEYLVGALVGGPAFIDENASYVYFLVPPSTARTWATPETACLTADTYLGVPKPGSDHRARCHWLVEMAGPADLCTPAAVSQLVMNARLRVASGQASG